MNYSRIYSEFIADRLLKQPRKPNYFEKHHIVPRSLGGSDSATNIIRLTPEDHFFAHLLLAKSRGLWAPVAFMVGGQRKDYKPTHSRVSHGWAMRAMAKSITGPLAYQFDTTTHALVNGEGKVWEGLQSEMPAACGLSRSLANMLIKGRISVARGWSLKGAVRKSKQGAGHPMYRSERLEFTHTDGRTFRGTQNQFGIEQSACKSVSCRLARGQLPGWRGWRLTSEVTPKRVSKSACLRAG